MGRDVTLAEPDGCERRWPIELEEVVANALRGPKHLHRTPWKRPDITQIKKIRQCEFVQANFFPH